MSSAELGAGSRNLAKSSPPLEVWSAKLVQRANSAEEIIFKRILSGLTD